MPLAIPLHACEILGRAIPFYGTPVTVLVVKTIDRSKRQTFITYNTKANQNDIIEFHIRPGEWQFPYTLEMLL